MISVKLVEFVALFSGWKKTALLFGSDQAWRRRLSQQAVRAKMPAHSPESAEITIREISTDSAVSSTGFP
jgi:hypothetical protein